MAACANLSSPELPGSEAVRLGAGSDTGTEISPVVWLRTAQVNQKVPGGTGASNLLNR